MSKRELRRRFIDEERGEAVGHVLEIGALDEPTLPDDPDVRYVDWFSAEQLRARHESTRHRDASRIVDVDYVIADKRFSAAISERFDVVIANHVIEHIADPITWLDELAAITVPGATLFLAVPDRNFTFDVLRPESTAVDLLRAHEDDLQRPDVWQILGSVYYSRPVRAADFWSGADLDEKLRSQRFSFDEAIAVARRHAEREYADVHCFVYSEASFVSVLRSLCEAHLVSWVIRRTAPVADGQQEFLACLDRVDGGRTWALRPSRRCAAHRRRRGGRGR